MRHRPYAGCLGLSLEHVSQFPNQLPASAPPDQLYLPIDPSPDRPTVQAQLQDPKSLLHLVRELIVLRQSNPNLGSRSSTTVLGQGYPFVYLRGNTHLVVVNPRRDGATFELPDGIACAGAVLAQGAEVIGSLVRG